ncbi:hypothetical protein BDQ17DRAFT_1414605 [Cyathus striatus]|nr:hypothetical protein BDQ17DRAFT_1414605 [Cyathus striatus]
MDVSDLVQWTVVVNNTFTPIWFYCQQISPVNHCQARMVFVVNQTTDEGFSAFQHAAKASTGSSSEIPSNLTASYSSVLRIPGVTLDNTNSDVVHNPLERGASLEIEELGVAEERVVSNDDNAAPVDTREILQERNTLRRELAEVRDAMAGDVPVAADRVNAAQVDTRELLQERDQSSVSEFENILWSMLRATIESCVGMVLIVLGSVFAVERTSRRIHELSFSKISGSKYILLNQFIQYTHELYAIATALIMHFPIFVLAAGVLPIVAFSAHLFVELDDMTFNPSNVTAAVGDTVVFKFLNGNHSVTQSTFANPCTPSSENISSGYISANSSNELQQQWTYEVGEISGPVWFYCQQTDPVNHCHAEMIFTVIPIRDPLVHSALQSAATTSGPSSSTINPSSSTAFRTMTSVPVTPMLNESTEESNSTAKKDIRLKIGILVGSICLTLIICLGAFLAYWRWKSKSRATSEGDWMITTPFINPTQQDNTNIDAVHNAELVIPRREAAVSKEKGANLGVRKPGVVEGSITSNDANVAWVDAREILQELDALRRELAEVRDSMASDPLLTEVGESVTDDTPPPIYYRASVYSNTPPHYNNT